MPSLEQMTVNPMRFSAKEKLTAIHEACQSAEQMGWAEAMQLISTIRKVTERRK